MSNKALIETQSISKYYEDGQVVALDKVTMHVNQGEILMIKGPSGCGKSTLMHLLGGLDSPSSGKILFQGQDIKQVFNKKFFRIKNIGFVFQAFYLWQTLNVFENVSLPLMELNFSQVEKDHKVKAVIDIVGLNEKLHTSVRNLSMGQRQRVAIARAIVADPVVVLADEPTGSLDSKNAGNILQLFRKINKDRGVTIVMVTHENTAREYYDRQVQLLDGKICT